MSFVSCVLETTSSWEIATLSMGVSTFDVSGARRVPTHCCSSETWERAEEIEETIQVKQPLRKGKRLRKSCSPTRSSETTGLVSTWGRIAMETHQKEHLEVCSADPGTDQFTVHLYIYNIYIYNTTRWEEGAVKAWIGWSITDQMPQTALNLLVLFLSPWVNCSMKEVHHSKYILLQYNANQHHSEHESAYSTCNKYF